MNLCVLPMTADKQAWAPADAAFVAGIQQRVQATITRFRLLRPDDKVLVAASGGKDSTVLMHVFHALGIPFEAVTVDTAIGCYTKQNLLNLRAFCAERSIPLHEIAFREEYGASVCYLRDAFKERGIKVHSCTICGVPRRTLINKAARRLGATVLATGHNLDDEAQAVLMNVIKSRPGQNRRLGPRASAQGFVARIKPLYLVREDEIARYSRLHAFPVHYGKCPCVQGSLRNNLREFFAAYESRQPAVRENILDWFLRWKNVRGTTSERSDLAQCASCGEPSTSGTCATCRLFLQLQRPAQA